MMGSALVPLKSALLMVRRKKGSWNNEQEGGEHQQHQHKGTKEQPKLGEGGMGGDWMN